jgi:hypothetical protein
VAALRRHFSWTVLLELASEKDARDAKRIFLGHEPDGVTDGYGPSHWDHVLGH